MKKVVNNNKPVFIVRKGLEADVYLRKNIVPLPDTKLFTADEVNYTTMYSDNLQTEVELTFEDCYKYGEVCVSIKEKKDRIALLKKELSDEDYKIIKCSEASLVGGDPPYNISVLYAKREKIREEINELETYMNQ